MRPAHSVLAGLAALIALAGWIGFNRPVPVTTDLVGPLASTSFAPYTRFQNPINDDVPGEAQIAADLKALQGRVLGVRTYSTRNGLDAVPRLAQPLGIKVTLGAWIGAVEDTQNIAKNDEEIANVIRLANEFPDTVSRVIIGNEVLLRGDLTPQELIDYIRRVKAAIRQPVSYADVWTFFLRYPEMAPELDYLTIHILPYWEDEPVSLDRAEAHVMNAVSTIRTAFPGKAILIGETGWPSLGRNRGPAVVSGVNQARYLREMATIADRNQLDYNIVEAFDQPWKSVIENTVGAAWGILDAERQPKFALTGPVTEVPGWPLRAAIAIGLGIAASLFFARSLTGLGAIFGLALLAQLLCWAAVTTGFHVTLVSFRWWQFIWAPFRILAPALLGLAILHRAAGLASGQSQDDACRYGEALIAGFALYAFAWTALLTFDGRYRDIPEIDLALPCLGVAALLLWRAVPAWRAGQALLPALSIDGLFPPLPFAQRDRLFAWLGLALLIGAAMTPIGEGFAIIGDDFVRDHLTFGDRAPLVLQAMLSNREMLLWSAMQLVMALPFLARRAMAHGKNASMIGPRNADNRRRISP